MKFETLQVHAGQHMDATHKSRAQPIYLSTSFAFESSEHAANVFNGTSDSYVYSRIGNPTITVFEERVAALEGASQAVAVSTGMAAQFAALSALVNPGDNIVSSAYLYGGSFQQLKFNFKRLMNVEFRFVGGDESVEEYEKLFDDRTRAVFVESIGNPSHLIPDFEGLSQLTKKWGIPFVVDNTFGAGGAMLQPLALGADIVVESATKWIGGHGTTLGGVVADGGRFDWTANADKFPQLGKPNPAIGGRTYVEKANGNEKAFARFVRGESVRDLGPSLSPFSAFMLLQGLETLSLRVERIAFNALKLAEWLEQSPYVSWVSYLGLKSHVHHERAVKYMKRGFGGVLTFGARPIDGKGQSGNVVDKLLIASHLANVGDCKTLVIAPYFTTHSMLTEEERAAALVTSDLVRVSVGIEHIDDLIEDFAQAFEKVYNGE